MARRSQADDAQAVRLMRILGELDIWNDARDGARCWYRAVRASYRRGELSGAEWAAYRAAYAGQTNGMPDQQAAGSGARVEDPARLHRKVGGG